MPKDDQWMSAKPAESKSKRPLLEWLPMRPKKGSREEQTLAILSNTPLFQDIGLQDWKLLSSLFHERSYSEDEIIFEKGMPGLGMYVILNGDVRIVGEEAGEMQTFAHLYAGDFFGEMAVIQEGVRSATAVADTPCELIGLFRPELRELLKDRTKLGVVIYERLARVMAERLRMADDRLLEKARQDVETSQ